MTTGLDLLSAAWAPLLDLADSIDDDRGWAATQLPGWSVRDLVFHLATDAQRGLVALFTPAPGAPDTDELDYWRAWSPGTDGARSGLRGTRAIASQWTSVRGPADLFSTTARALLRAAGSCPPDDVVATQGRSLQVDALLRTLAVEATVHHLDLGRALPDRPAPVVLAEVRRVLDALLGRPAPAGWDDVRWARLGTGREQPTAAERAELGAAVRRLPLFG